MKPGPRSMTGFGSAEIAVTEGTVGAEVRSVNSRHLDVRVRLPRDLAALEPAARERVTPLFRRGQVEVNVRLRREAEGPVAVEVDLAAARRYRDAAAVLAEEPGIEGALSLSTLLELPGVSRLREPDLDVDALAGAVLQAVESAAGAACEMRAREGEALARELGDRVRGVVERVDAIEARVADLPAAQRERLLRRVAGLAPDVELDPARLEQEVVLHVDRADVTEEVVRLRSHCEQFVRTLGTEGAVGRKLEFLLQEMGREANTIGSKAADAPVAHEVVELKAELEKLREQVLNIE